MVENIEDGDSVIIFVKNVVKEQKYTKSLMNGPKGEGMAGSIRRSTQSRL